MALDIQIGDLFNATAGKRTLVLHGCNAKGVMGSGVAKIIKDLHPEAYLVYKQAERRYGLKLGQAIIWENPYADRCIANVITQAEYGRNPYKVYVDYDAVICGLQNVLKYVDQYMPAIPIHLPLIGGGLANGDRKRLIAIFEAVFHAHNATLWIKEDEQ
jgi:O-acetyl-ADP-ribose deacetylase (regulator of RNase III)